MSHESDFLADLYQKYDAINLVSKPETYYNRLQREGVEEGKMSDIALDMKELSDAEFKKKHGKSKEEMKDALGEDGHTDVDSMQRKTVVMIKDLMALHAKFKEMDGTGNLDTWLTNKLAVAQSDVEAVKNYLTNDVEDSDEMTEKHGGEHSSTGREMTKAETDKKEKIVKSMKKDKAGFRKRYGKDADAVMYATATKLAMKDDKSQIGESTMSDKKKLNEGISITTDTLEDSIALMTILKNAGLDPSQMNIQGQQPSMPEPEAPMAPMGDEPEAPKSDMEGPVDAEPETEMYANDKDEAYLDKDDFELKRNKVPNSKMGPSAASRGDNPLPEGEEHVNEYYVKTADDVMVNLPAFAYRKSNPSHDNTPKDKKYVAAIGDKADMVHSKLKKWLASGNNFNPNQIKMLDQVASKIEFLDPMDQTDEEVIDMLNSGLDTVMSIIEPKTSEEVDEAKHAKPDFLDLDKDGDKKEPMKKAAKDKEKKKDESISDTDRMIEELNKQYELMLVGGAQDALGLTASARIIADESLYDGAKFVIAEVVTKPEGGLVAEDGAWEGDTTNYTVAYLVKEGKIVGQIGAGNVPYLSRDGNGTYPVNHKLNVLDLSGKNFFEDHVLAVDSIKSMYEDLGEEMFGEVTTEFGGCEMLRNE